MQQMFDVNSTARSSKTDAPGGGLMVQTAAVRAPLPVAVASVAFSIRLILIQTILVMAVLARVAARRSIPMLFVKPAIASD